MRLWSLHPSYLDSKGLVACWREGLLARRVLQGKTKGYKNHPQLNRFKTQIEPVIMLDSYLLNVLKEAAKRSFVFNHQKIGPHFSKLQITVTNGQLEYELRHLIAKLKVRDIKHYAKIIKITSPLPNPIFSVVEGDLELWERVHE